MLTSPSFPLGYGSSARQARLLAESTFRCAVILLGAEGHILSWNPGAQRLYGHHPDAALGRHLRTLFGEQATEQDIQHVLQGARSTGRHQAECWNRRQDGTPFRAACTVLALGGADGAACGYAWLAVDLMHDRRLEDPGAGGRWHWNPETDSVAFSPCLLRMLALPDPPPAGAGAWLQLVHGDDRRLLRRLAAEAWNARQHAPLSTEARLLTGSGEFRWFRLQAGWQHLGLSGPPLLSGTGIEVHEARLARDECERIAGAIAVCAAGEQAATAAPASGPVPANLFDNLRTLQDTLAALAVEREKAHLALRLLTDSVILTDAAGRIDYLNPAGERMTGWPLAQARGLPAASVIRLRCPREASDPDPVAECLASSRAASAFYHGYLRSRCGRELAVDVSAAPMHDAGGQLLGSVVALHDVSALHDLLHTLEHQASHDSLTGLLNRREFETRLQSALDNAHGGCGNGALIYLDLDQFKIVNDTCGHAAGDALLQQLALAYRAAVREGDAIARLGGDEFALVIERCSAEEATRVADKLLEATAAFRFNYGKRVFRIGASMGVVPITMRASSVEHLLRLADHACYLAKESGRHRIHVHREKDEAMTQRLNDMHWVGRLNDALRGNQLELYYQPIASMTDEGGLLHYEILLRLKGKDGSCISPAAFMPAAERFDLMPAIDRWVLKRVLDWLEGEPEHVHRLDMATINLSRRTLADESFQQYAIACLENSPVPADKLCFEITENGAIADPARTIRFIETLKDRGCRFSLDDFGTGMTSFSYLKLLPVDFIKIDGSFVTMMGESAVDREMVRFANEISHIMGRRTIAEYVSDAGIYERLRELRIDYAQGNWIGAPRPLEAQMRQ